MGFPEFPDPLKPQRTGTEFDYANVDGSPDLAGYTMLQLNQEKLVDDLLTASWERRNLDDFYFKDYEGWTSTETFESSALNEGEEYSYTVHHKTPVKVKDGYETVTLGSFHSKINRRAGRSVDPKPRFRIDIDVSRTYTRYSVEWVFVAGTKKLAEDEGRTIETVDVDYDIANTERGRILAIELWTTDAEQFILMHKRLNSPFHSVKGYIVNEFWKVYYDLKEDDYEHLYNFYRQAPLFFLAKVDLSSLFDNLIDLLIYDIRKWFLDTGDVMIKALTAIIGKDGGTEFIYQNFSWSGYIAKQVYYELDESGKSVLHGGQDVPHKSIFASMLWMIADDNNQWRNYPEHNKTHIRFNVTPGHRVDSNILWGDEFKDKFDLTQETYSTYTVMQNLGGFMDGSISIDRYPVEKSRWVAGTTHHLHPLDMVTLVLEGPDGRDQELIVPAIFVKDLAHHREWAEVMAIVRLVINIFIIVVSLVTLIFGNPGPLMVAISIIDLGLATTDIAVQAFADEIRGLKGGQEFLDTWEAVYLVAGIVTALPLLGNLLKSGAKLLGKAMSAEARVQLLSMLRHALQGAKNFPKFVKGAFTIITDFALELGSTVGLKMKRLSEQGVMLLKGVEEGQSGTKYFLSYRGETLRSGSLRQIKSEISSILKQGKDGLSQFLDRLFFIKTGTGGGFRYLSEVESLKMFAQEEPMSCAAACIRQLLKDNGITVTEQAARTAAKTDGLIEGTILPNIGPGLEQLFPGAKIAHGSVLVEGVNDFGKVAKMVTDATSHSWIATLKPFSGPRHTVLVDKIVDGVVYIRDPWNPTSGFGISKNGAEATMSLADFVDLWRGSRFHHVRIL